MYIYDAFYACPIYQLIISDITIGVLYVFFSIQCLPPLTMLSPHLNALKHYHMLPLESTCLIGRTYIHMHTFSLCILDILYTCNLYNFIKRCHPNTFNEKIKIKKIKSIKIDQRRQATDWEKYLQKTYLIKDDSKYTKNS